MSADGLARAVDGVGSAANVLAGAADGRAKAAGCGAEAAECAAEAIQPVAKAAPAVKVLHVVLAMTVGGAEKLIYEMVRHPAFAKRRPAVCCLDTLGELGERLAAEGYSVHVMGRRSGLDLSVIGWLKDIIRKEGATVVHAHQYTPLFYATPAALWAGRVRVVYTEHGRFYPDRKSWKRTLFDPLLALGVDHLVSISRATALAMARYDNLPLRRIRVIHNGVDCSCGRAADTIDRAAKRRELGLSATCRVIGTASRLNSIKNIQMMLRVFKLVLQQAPDTCLLIAGEGEEEENLKAVAGELGIAEQVKFAGLRFDLPEIYPLFEVFLLTSFSEGVSVTLLESMACGVPAVVTDVGGNGEVVVEGRTGHLVPLEDDQQMAGCICALLQDRARAASMGQAARERVRDDFSVDGMVETYRALYGPVAATPQPFAKLSWELPR